MRLTLALTVLSLGFLLDGLASPSSADGIALRWSNCVADGGTSNVAFACNTNSGTQVLVPSFTLDAPLPSGIGARATLDVVAFALELPEWWKFFAGCRSGSLITEAVAVGPIQCELLGGFNTTDGINSYVVGVNGPNTAQLTFSSGRPSTLPPLSAGVEYILTGLQINNNRTVGSPSCTGCDIGVCLTLTELTLRGPNGVHLLTITTPSSPGGAAATWQGGGSGHGGSCMTPTPTRRSAWGAIKSLYR